MPAEVGVEFLAKRVAEVGADGVAGAGIGGTAGAGDTIIDLKAATVIARIDKPARGGSTGSGSAG